MFKLFFYRAHLNDLENIPLFWILGLLFVLTNPSSLVASICFRTFTIARIAHTVFYLNEIALPRGMSFMAALAVNTYMGLSILYSFCS